MKYRIIYLLVSGLLILAGIFGLTKWGLILGIDFRGGTIAEYSFEEKISTEGFSEKLKDDGIQVFSIQDTQDGRYILRLSPLTTQDQGRILKILQTSYL